MVAATNQVVVSSALTSLVNVAKDLQSSIQAVRETLDTDSLEWESLFDAGRLADSLACKLAAVYESQQEQAVG